jgi:membrane protein DedA with SNARE-associated domain
LGGPGLILVGLVDNSAIPVPGGMDVFVILLSAAHRSLWPYYAVMAVIGAVVGGYLSYRLAEKGGEELLEKKIGKQRAEKIYRRFKNRGFFSIAIGAVLPPPFPLVPVLFAAGALHYPPKKFIAALTLGRTVRFFTLAYLAHRWGDAIIASLKHYDKPLLWTFLALGVLGGIAALVYFKWYRPRHQQKRREHRGSASRAA